MVVKVVVGQPDVGPGLVQAVRVKGRERGSVDPEQVGERRDDRAVRAHHLLVLEGHGVVDAEPAPVPVEQGVVVDKPGILLDGGKRGRIVRRVEPCAGELRPIRREELSLVAGARTTTSPSRPSKAVRAAARPRHRADVPQVLVHVHEDLMVLRCPPAAARGPAPRPATTSAASRGSGAGRPRAGPDRITRGVVELRVQSVE